jgi:hypothetical protein
MYFDQNQIVELVLTGIFSVEGDEIPEVNHSFASEFSTIYSTPNKIRALAGSYIRGVPDEVLWYLIHTYSVEADMISTCASLNPQKWGYYAGLWVTYKTALNSIYNADIYLGESGNKSYKKLGDFSVSKDGSKSSSSPAKGLIEKLECDIFKVEVAVRTCVEPLLQCTPLSEEAVVGATYSPKAAQPATRGGSLPRPAFGRTFYSNGVHPQWTGMIKVFDKWQLTNSNPYSGNTSDSRYQRS